MRAPAPPSATLPVESPVLITPKARPSAGANVGSGTTLGLRAAAGATVLALAFGASVLLAAAASPVSSWDGIALYTAEFEGIQMLPLVPGLLLAPAVVLLLACIHRAAPPDQRTHGLAALGFGIVYAAVASLGYTTQLIAVRPALLARETEGLALHAIPNPASLFAAYESTGRLFLGLATLAAIPIVARAGRVGAAVAALFALNALLGGLGLVAAVAGWEPLLAAGLVAWCVSFPLATALLAVLFRPSEPLGRAMA
jgi:hypothetical protein